jgi:tetratricopeptide (TPR) repeat protein
MVFAIVASVVVVIASVLLLRGSTSAPSRPLVATVADIQAVHSSVSVGGSDVRRTRRVAVEDVVETDSDGRGRLRLDDGTAFVIDRSTKLRLTRTGIALEHGRVFVQGAIGAHTEIDLGQVTGIVSGADAAVERPTDQTRTAKIYSVNAEITVRAAGADQTVQAGFTASVSGDKVTIVPERGFDDWTGGMAAPWGARGAPRRAVGELWGRGGATAGDVGSPLTIRAHDVRAKVTREVAETEVRTTFFNAGSENVKGDFRMAIPSGAIVSRFASEQGESLSEGRVALARRDQSLPVTNAQVLEWAGEGWVRATIPSIAPGETVSIIVGYVEWLSPSLKGDSKNWVVQYRYPMVSDAVAPLIGEFSARVDAAPSSPLSIGSSLGARVSGYAVEVRRPDFRPSSDLVVDIEIDPWAAPARLYTAPPQQGSDEDGATVLVRTETPAAAREDGVTLALVVDTSASMEPALLDAERAVVEAVVGSLGARDKVVVLAADQTARPVGPAAMGPVDAARRKAIAGALASLEPGGATDLGRALEAGADALPADAPAGMVIYIGDGWPTLGDPNVDAIQARLARRPGGAPRLGAVAVGPVVNRFALAGLVRGSGPLLEIADSSEAARVAIGLIAEALQPTVAGVEILFGPEVERIYPRGARAVVAGDTVFATGRVRGAPPKEITLRWRDSKGSHDEKRLLVSQRAAHELDVSRRWAAARVEEIALKGKGREAATDVALRAGLLTPWTGWVIGGGDVYVPSLFQTRILDLAPGPDGGFSAAFATPRGVFGTLANVPRETEEAEDGADSEDAYKSAVAEASARVIDDAAPSVRACRDSRAALRPELGGNLDVRLDVDGDGRAKDVRVRGAAGSDDDALNRCVEVVISGLVFPASGLTVTIKVNRTMALPPPRSTLRGRKCSATSMLLLPLRRGVWQERLIRAASSPHTVYLEAKQTCELPLWTDRRALLELMLLAGEDGLWRVKLARDLATAGEADAAALIRREAVRRARSPEELRAIKVALLGDENYPAATFRKQYKAAPSDQARLAVVRRFLALAPHDARLRRRLLALLEAMAMKQELAEEVRRIRLDPFADAGLLADSASALRRIGDEPEARRAFGELAERAPHDPWARAFLGDRLRNEGYYDDASLAYTVLEQLVPDDPAAILRLALAHAGAGRLDIAQRMLARVAQTGGRAGDAQLGELAGRLAQSLIAAGRAQGGVSKEDQARLARVALELPYPAGATLVLVRAPAGALPIEATLIRGPNGAREERPAEIAAAGIGLYSLRMDAGDTQAVLRLKRPEELSPARPTSARVDTLLPDHDDSKPPRIVSTEIELPFTGKPIELKWTGDAWIAG